MASFIFTVICVVALCVSPSLSTSAFRAMFPKHPPMVQNGIDPGTPLFLTPYIEKGQIEQARQASMMGPLPGTNLKSYGGFLTVNKTHNSNMYFWFIPAQNDPGNAPVLLWLQGGPGGSSLFGMFVENGPYGINKDIKLTPRNITWNSKYSMLYIDNPVGTGFSFTGDDAGYATNEVDVARDLYSCLTQFYQIFYDFQKNGFYVTGESYAGKYVPAITYRIHMENPTAKVKINLKGMAIGDGLCDPLTMMPQYADYLFNIGYLDENQRDYFQTEANKAVNFILKGQYMDAFKVFDMLLNGDLIPYPSYFYNVTGTTNYYNFLMTNSPEYFSYYPKFLAMPEIRKSIHVGNLTYNDGSAVEKHLLNDIMNSVKPWVTTILDGGYQALFYTGQLDIIVALPLTEAFLMTVPWKGQAAYKEVERLIWKINPSDAEVAGYVRQVGKVVQVLVRGGGHILPYDQPARAFDMIDRFITSR